MLKAEAIDAESISDTAQTIEIPIINRKEKVNNEPEGEMKALVFNTCWKSYYDKGGMVNVQLCIVYLCINDMSGMALNIPGTNHCIYLYSSKEK